MPPRRPSDHTASEDAEDYESLFRVQPHRSRRQGHPSLDNEPDGENSSPILSWHRRSGSGVENNSDLIVPGMIGNEPKKPRQKYSSDEISSLASSVQRPPRHESSTPGPESSTFLRLRGGSRRRGEHELVNESPEDRQFRLAIEASEAEARNARSRPPSDLNDDDLERAIRASQEEAERLARERAHREDEESEREADILAESRRLGNEAATRAQMQRRQDEAEVERILRESAAEAESREAEDEAELQRLMASFGNGRSGTVASPSPRTASASSSSRPQRPSGPRMPPTSVPASSSRTPNISSPLAHPSNVINAEAITNSSDGSRPRSRDRGSRGQTGTSLRQLLETNASTRNSEQSSMPRDVERTQALSRSASARSAGSESHGSSTPTSRNSGRPRASSLLSNYSTSSSQPTRNASTSSRGNPRPGRSTGDEAAEMQRAINESRMNEINQILERSDPSDPRYLAALASLDQVDGSAQEAPNLEDTGLEDGFRPPSYPEIKKDRLINHLKYTTTNEGRNEAGRKMLITPAILKMMKDAAVAMAAAQEREPVPQSRSAAKRNPLDAAMAASKAEVPTSESLEVAQSLEETLDRTFLNERRGQVTTTSTRSVETPAPAPATATDRRAQMTQLAVRDRPAWNEPFTRIPNSGGYSTRRRTGRTGL